MVKLVGMLILVAAAFFVGYYVGQRSLADLEKTVAELSRSFLDKTLGLQRNFRFRQSLLDAKAQVVQAKSELLDRNYGNAAKELAVAVEDLQKAAEAERDTGKPSKVKPLTVKAREAHLELTMGKSLPRARLDEIQQELDDLLAGN